MMSQFRLNMYFWFEINIITLMVSLLRSLLWSSYDILSPLCHSFASKGLPSVVTQNFNPFLLLKRDVIYGGPWRS